MTPQETREAKERLILLLREKLRRREAKADRGRLENSLSEFFKDAWKILEPGRKLIWSWHYDLICEYLWLARENKLRDLFPGVSGIIANVPPRTAKSNLISICFPVWCWLKHPERRFLNASYEANLAEDFSVRRRDLIQSTWFFERWGDKFKLKYDQNQKSHVANDKTGSMISVGTSGAATGKGGDDVLLDDPIKADDALSDIKRKGTNDTIDQTFRSRLNDPNGGLIIIIMQRLHEMDPTGFLLSTEPERWIHLKFPLEAEEHIEHVFPISKRVVIREKGDILQPDRFNALTLSRLKNRRLVWAGQYQQRPAPLEGNLIKRAEVKYYNGVDPLTALHDAPVPEHFDLVVVSADCTFKDGEKNDFVCVGTVGVRGPKRYVLEVVNKHLDLGATEAEVKRQHDTHGASAVLIEDKANGSAIIKRMKNVVSGVIAIEPEGGKDARMFAAAPEWQAGDWYVDRNAAWTEPFITQLISYPNASHDDMVDFMSQTAIWLQRSRIFMDMAEDLRSGGSSQQPPQQTSSNSLLYGNFGG